MLRKNEVIKMRGIPIGTAEVIITDGGMIILGNARLSCSQENLGLITEMMSFDGKESIVSGEDI